MTMPKSQVPTGPAEGALEGPPRQLLLLILGFCVWASALVLVYFLHTLGCSFGWTVVALRGALATVLLLHLGLIGVAWHRCAERRADPAAGATDAFIVWVTLWTLISAFVTIIVTLGPALVLTTCL